MTPERSKQISAMIKNAYELMVVQGKIVIAKERPKPTYIPPKEPICSVTNVQTGTDVR